METLIHVFLAVAGFSTLICCNGNKESSYKSYTLSGPYEHQNLTIFLFHGANMVNYPDILTLDEALEQQKIIIHETEDVNELSMENVSDQPVFIQAGDIVKGGKQDRVLADDIIVAAHSGKIPIAAFCVEHGRWSRRGAESLHSFHSSGKQLASKNLRLAAKAKKSQAEVWQEVSYIQDKLGSRIGQSVRSEDSESSLQLTLENKEIEKKTRAYVDHLLGIIDKNHNVLGFAFAVNGEFNSVDLYGHTALMQKLWPKMLEACAVEAVADYDAKAKTPVVTMEHLLGWLKEMDAGKEKQKLVDDRIYIKIRESDKNILFDTYDRKMGDLLIHRNMIKK
ncbi:hypothetical protein JXO59_08115 [candidate division KSB1 bacterium]|nr:hypothetical protein [candidate division KSB1 bacterium]